MKRSSCSSSPRRCAAHCTLTHMHTALNTHALLPLHAQALIEVLKLQQQPEVVAQRLAYLQRTSVRVTDQDRTQCEVGGGSGVGGGRWGGGGRIEEGMPTPSPLSVPTISSLFGPLSGLWVLLWVLQSSSCQCISSLFSSRPPPPRLTARPLPPFPPPPQLGDMMNAFLGSFCRRCRTYGCRTHGGCGWGRWGGGAGLGPGGGGGGAGGLRSAKGTYWLGGLCVGTAVGADGAVSRYAVCSKARRQCITACARVRRVAPVRRTRSTRGAALRTLPIQ